MPAAVLPLNETLRLSSRLPARDGASDRVQATEWLVLLGMGACAAVAVAALDFGIRVPGHAILRAVFPMACGLAAVPRRKAGLVMAAGAITTAGLMRASGGPLPGTGAMTSLCLIGPLLDLAASQARPGWRLYAAFAAAGLGANVAAFAVRGGTKATGLGVGGVRPLGEWLSVAPISYAVCGLVAGLVSAAVWFRFRTPGPTGSRAGGAA